MKKNSSNLKRVLTLTVCTLTFAASSSQACLSFPKKISLAKSSFENEVFSFPETDKGIAFEHNQTSFFYNHVTNQWCVFADKSKKEDAPICLKDGQKLYLTDDREGATKGKELGLITVSGKSLMLFSCNGKEKDTNRPYLKLTDATTVLERNRAAEAGTMEKIYKSALKVEAMSLKQGVLGNFDIEARAGGPLATDGSIKAPKMRSLSLGNEESAIELTGKSVTAEAGCSGKTKIENLSESSGSGASRGDNGGPRGGSR